MKPLTVLLALWISGCSPAPLADAGPDAPVDAPSPIDVPRLDAPRDGGVPTFHCAPGPLCPEVLIELDPQATYPTHPFHGVGDPSLEIAEDGSLYLSYSWLATRVTPPGDRVDFTVETHLAHSVDGGRSFTLERTVNTPTAMIHWETPGREGLIEHEVSTLTRRGSDWQLLWLSYFDEYGAASDNRSDFYFASSVAAAPSALGDTGRLDMMGFLTSRAVGAFDASSLTPVADCGVFTEPALFTHEGVTYLAATCLSFAGPPSLTRQRTLDRMVLFRQEGDGYTYVGVLLDADDAAQFGADSLEQADLSIARDGAILLLVTPLIDGADPVHQGCVALEVQDLATATLRRDGDALHVRARITAEGNGLGPGLCTYEATSETGVLMVVTRFDLMPLPPMPPNLAFTLHATGFHP